MIEIIIDAADSMQRVDKYLLRQLPGAGKSLIYKQIRKKNITLNGAKMTGQEKLAKGDILQLYFADETYEKFREPLYNELNEKTLALCDKAYETLDGIKAVYEDENILVLNKPMGILSQQATPNDMSLNEWAIGYLHNKGEVDARSLAHFKPSVLNRLDRNTSGMVIVGKTLLGSNTCSELIRNRKIEKYYLTMVMGKLEGSRTLFGYHIKDGRINKAEIKDNLLPGENENDYDLVETRYRSIKTMKQERLGDISLLEVELVTGKSHQIRAHMAHIGHPVVGDTKYGDKKYERALFSMGIKNQLLHSYKLVFPKKLPEGMRALSEKVLVCMPEWLED